MRLFLLKRVEAAEQQAGGGRATHRRGEAGGFAYRDRVRPDAVRPA